MPDNTSIWTFAGLTAAVGMGVVFAALFLLSTYMHFFKIIIARIEGRGKPAPAPTPKSTASPVVTPVPGAPAATEGARIAAAVAVGLHLRGMRGAGGDEVAAAIATALALHRGRSAATEAAAARPASGWKLAGRMEAMTSRAKRHERPVGR